MKIKFLLCMALAITLFSCGKDDEPWNDDANGQSNTSSVVINADGSTSTGVSFSMLDGTTFYLDYIKYQIVDSHLEIVGYDPAEIADDVRPYAYVTLNGTKYNTRVIALGAFLRCKMRNMVVPLTVQKAYLNCGNISQIIIPNSVTELYICDGNELCELKIPDSVTDLMVTGCKKLTEIIVPNSVQTIRFPGFQNCTSLKKIILPEKLEYFDYSNIANCPSLSDIYLGECVEADPYCHWYGQVITFHVKSEYIEKMTRKLNPKGRDNIIVIGDYSSSIK